MEEIELLNEAFKIYNLNGEIGVTERLLDYIFSRLIANKANIEKMIEISNSDVKFEDIINTFKKTYREVDEYREVDGYFEFLTGQIGNVLVETNDVLDVVKYFVRGIKSRNTITISQNEYYELSLSNFVLVIFVEALAKYNLSRNTLMILPYEECYPEEFDEVIIIEDGKKIVKKNKIKSEPKIKTDELNKDDKIEKIEEKIEEKSEENVEKGLIEVVNPWYKRIFEKIKSIFFKK